jgi:hypothetical protein
MAPYTKTRTVEKNYTDFRRREACVSTMWQRRSSPVVRRGSQTIKKEQCSQHGAHGKHWPSCRSDEVAPLPRKKNMSDPSMEHLPSVGEPLGWLDHAARGLGVPAFSQTSVSGQRR